MKTQILSKMLVGVIVCVVAVIGIVPTSAAGTQSGEVLVVPLPPGINHERDYLLFEQALDRLELALQGQRIRLDLANLSITQAGEWVSILQENGKDTTDLEAAIAAFEGQIRAAESAHNNARNIIAAKAGFDANGQVVDEEQARQTLKNARDAMKQCANTVNPAAKDFREAIKAFVHSLRPE